MMQNFQSLNAVSSMEGFMIKNLFQIMRPKKETKVLREHTRGMNAAEKFIASKPSHEEILKYWSCACVDADMCDTDAGRAYALGVKSVMRPIIAAGKLP